MNKKPNCPDVVYCSKCKYYRPGRIINYGLEKCLAVFSIYHDYRRCYKKYGNPAERNKNNDCKLFEEKRLSFLKWWRS